MTKIVVACASFKGTLSSREAGAALQRGFEALGFQTLLVALADGGEGLVEALASQMPHMEFREAPCRDPFGKWISARFAMTRDGGKSGSHRQAIIEMAASSGLPLIPENLRNPMIATTLGVGDQIRSALDSAGAQGLDILMGIGGSATNDGGAGMAQALGARLLDAEGCDLPPGGAALINLARIDMTGFHPKIAATRFTVACDVVNPLCGIQGASRIYGPQKGASPEDVQILDLALEHFANIVRRDLGCDVSTAAGAGAAGGLGAGCMAFLKASLKPGIDLVLDTLSFDAALNGAALVVTGEGYLDEQTLMGKACAGVALRATRAGIPCVAIGGGIDESCRSELLSVFRQVESLSAFAGSLDQARSHGAKWLEKLARENAAHWLAS